MKPEFINQQEIEGLKSKHSELFVHDEISIAINELFDISFPSKKDTKTRKEVNKFGKELTGDNESSWGEWVYYPWLNMVVHVPPKDELRALRTSRNRNLITAEEQKHLYDSTLLIIGMSVGSNVVEALVSQGIGGKLLLVDMDIIEPSNLNRIRSPYHHVGLHKVEAISRKVWEIDPYIEIVSYKQGLNEDNLSSMFEEHAIDVVVDEMDELYMKVLLREEAKKRKISVVMAADDGDDSLIDIERYDLNPDLPIFSNRIPKHVLDRIKAGNIPRPELGMMIGRYFVGAENIPLRMYQSLGEVGKTLPSWPQLGGAAALSGVSIAYVIKSILSGSLIKEGRSLISLNEKLDMEHMNQEHVHQLKQFQQMMRGNIK